MCLLTELTGELCVQFVLVSPYDFQTDQGQLSGSMLLLIIFVW